jgi:F-type H+-transporting ATPase subunit b
MLELNKWFFVQMINFLLLLVILNIILFRPILRIFKERENSTTGFLDDAKAMQKEKDGLMAQIDAKLSEARSKSKSIFDGLSDEGKAAQKQVVGSAQNQSVEINKKAREDIQAATERASASLKGDIESFSKKIVEKLVGI